jgi:hypothetical protein
MPHITQMGFHVGIEVDVADLAVFGKPIRTNTGKSLLEIHVIPRDGEGFVAPCARRTRGISSNPKAAAHSFHTLQSRHKVFGIR